MDYSDHTSKEEIYYSLESYSLFPEGQKVSHKGTRRIDYLSYIDQRIVKEVQ